MGKPFQRKDRNDKDWYISYYEPGGNRIKRRIGPSKKLAEAALSKIEVALAEGRYLEVKNQDKLPFERFADEYLRTHCLNKKSFHSYHDLHVRILKVAFKGKCLDEIKPLDIEKFKNARLEQVSPATVNRSLACLKSMFNRAIVWGRYEGVNPSTRVKMCKEKNIRLRYLEKEEITRLVENCSEDLRPIVIMAVNTGMRRGEILNLKWHDVDFKRDVISLLETKSDEKREVPMNEAVKDALIKVRKNPKSPYIFCYKNGEQVKDIRKSFWTALKKSGIKDFRFHDLRHSAASHLVMAGIDLNTVREILGHKTIEMTLRYAHLSPNHKKHAVDVLGQSIGLQKVSTSSEIVPIWSPEEKIEKEQIVNNNINTLKSYTYKN